MSPELAALREIERQRNDLLAGLALAAAYEKMASAPQTTITAAKAARRAQIINR